MFTCIMETEQALGRIVYNNMKRRTGVSIENLELDGNKIAKTKQVQKRVKSNDGSLYIEHLELANALNVSLTHHLHNQFESRRRFVY